MPRTSLASAVLRTGLLAGALDATGATVHYLANGGRTPARIFLYIASAAIGPRALDGGAPMVAAGLALHFGIAMIWTVSYFAAASPIALLRTRPIPAAVLYGAFVWIIMNRVVVPLSQAASRPFIPLQALIAAGVLMLCIGLPNAYGARAYYARRDG